MPLQYRAHPASRVRHPRLNLTPTRTAWPQTYALKGAPRDVSLGRQGGLPPSGGRVFLPPAEGVRSSRPGGRAVASRAGKQNVLQVLSVTKPWVTAVEAQLASQRTRVAVRAEMTITSPASLTDGRELSSVGRWQKQSQSDKTTHRGADQMEDPERPPSQSSARHARPGGHVLKHHPRRAAQCPVRRAAGAHLEAVAVSHRHLGGKHKVIQAPGLFPRRQQEPEWIQRHAGLEVQPEVQCPRRGQGDQGRPVPASGCRRQGSPAAGGDVLEEPIRAPPGRRWTDPDSRIHPGRSRLAIGPSAPASRPNCRSWAPWTR